jgi:hydroxyacylglutathione hydrolase
VRLTADIHLVASGSGGFDLTDPYDCNAYLVASEGEAAIVDTGIGAAVDALLANVAAAVPGWEDAVRYVLLTHAHPDHAGGAAELAERLPRARVLASPEVARWVAAGDERAMSLERGQSAEFYPPGYRFRACPRVEPLNDGDRVRVGGVELEAIATPGHAAGHLAFLASGATSACFVGDLVFHGGQISLESNWDCSLQDYEQSVRRLAERAFEVFLPGHHEFSLRRGDRHVRAAAQRFERGFVPQSVV